MPQTKWKKNVYDPKSIHIEEVYHDNIEETITLMEDEDMMGIEVKSMGEDIYRITGYLRLKKERGISHV